MARAGRIEIFLEVAREQSFSKAARMLGLTGPAVSKQVMALEADLGVKLLQRTTRLVTLTEEGARYYERVRHAFDELQEAAQEIQDLKATPQGPLKVNIPLSFGQMHLLPVLSGFAKKYPGIVMDISLDDRQVDVVGEGFDLVVRIGALKDSSLIVRTLAECPIYPVASPEFLRRYGMPQSPADLKSYPMIAYSHHGGGGEWRYRAEEGGTAAVVRPPVAFRANTAEMMLQAAIDGVGFAVLPEFSVAVSIRAGQLVRLLPGYETYPRRQIAAITPPNRYRSAKVTLLLDWIAASCKALPTT